LSRDLSHCMVIELVEGLNFRGDGLGKLREGG